MPRKDFTTYLMQWNAQKNTRVMPWKGELDAYKIWISEIILQQTRVEQGWAYYERFIQKFPTVQQLAQANDEDIFKLWEGLGYYNRCKNLLFTARLIVTKYQGIFPNSYDEIINLKGIGTYTASAIASFAFNLPYAVVDGNVFRVLARVFAIQVPTDTAEGKKIFLELANSLLDKNRPGLYNQAIMDFGATVCKPFAPACNMCNINKICKAFENGIVNDLPIKEKIIKKKNRWLYYFIFLKQDTVMVRKRMQQDIWQNLHEFYLVESTEAITWDEQEIENILQNQLHISKYTLLHISPTIEQQLTHQKIKGQFITIQLTSIPKNIQQYKWHSRNKMDELAFPKFINQYLDKYFIENKNEM